MFKKTLMLSLVLVMLATSFVFADADQSTLSKITGLTDQEIAALNVNRGSYGRIITASIVSKLTGSSVQDVLTANEQGKTFFEIAQAGGVELEQYKEAMLDTKEAYIDEQVKSGNLTQEQADALKERVEQRIESCDGQNMNGFQRNFGSRMRMGMGRGQRGNGLRFNSGNNL